MKEKIEIKGYWFLPNTPKTKVAGVLVYEPNKKIILELLGELHPENKFFFGNSNSFKIIHGESSEGKCITLINSFGYGSRNLSASFPIRKLTVQWILNGIHINDKTDKVFNKICFQLPLLASWVNDYRLQYSIKITDNKPDGFILKYDHSNDHFFISNKLDYNYALELDYTCTPPASLYQEKLQFYQSYAASIRSKRNVSFIDLLIKALRFQHFLSLAALTSIDFEKITLYSPLYFQEIGNNDKVFLPIELLYNQHSNYKDNSNNSFLFTYDKIKNEFPVIIDKWFSFDALMEPIINHLVESISMKDIFKTGDFLVVIQALEGFCTRFRSHYKKLDKNHRFINLNDRLIQLKQEFSFIPNIKKMRFRITTIVNTRNYYSHFYNKKGHVAKGEQLYKITQQLKILLVCCLLKETGFPNEKILLILKDYISHSNSKYLKD